MGTHRAVEPEATGEGTQAQVENAPMARDTSTATANRDDFSKVPGPSPQVEAQRRRTLRNHKAFVTALLIVAAVIFLGCSWWQSQEGGAPTWVGYVRAASEAGMIGGLADWFA